MKVTLYNPQQAHDVFKRAWEAAKAHLMEGGRLTLDLSKETRSTDQNRRLWAMLTDVARQVDWYGQKLTPDDWKHVFTASLKKQRAVPGLEGGFVVLGTSTSKMTIQEMTELMDLIEAFGADKGVKFTTNEGNP